jgi:hypothetical protein
MKIFIGSENKLFALSGSSVIAAPYRGRRRQGGRRGRRYRADSVELCAGRTHGGFHGTGTIEIDGMNDEQELAGRHQRSRGGGRRGAGPRAGFLRAGEGAGQVRQHVLYAQAETQNVRRRLEQEKQTAATYAATGFARDMLSVKDNLDRALAAIPTSSGRTSG